MFYNIYMMKSFVLNYLCCCIPSIQKNHNILYNMNTNLYDILQHVEYSNTIPFVPPIYYGKVIKVYDGDTITIASVLPNTTNPIYRFSVRLNGIDTPEIKGKTPEERELAKHARDALIEKIYGKFVELRNVETEKYGRILADVYLDNEHINQWLIDMNFAVAYDGGTKTRPASWGIL